MHRIGRFVVQGRMWSFLVVYPHRLRHHFARLFQVCRSTQQELAFQNAVDAFGQRILIAVITVCHGASQSMTTMNFLIVSRAILDAPV